MLDLKFIRENQELVREKLSQRGDTTDLSGFLNLDSERRSALGESETLRAQRNQTSDLIARLKKEGSDAKAEIERMKVVSSKIKEIEETLRGLDEKLNRQLLEIPNIPHESVPVCNTEDDNNQQLRSGDHQKNNI